MAKEIKKAETKENDCFIIMPIADPEGYEKGHFKKVYEDILKVACDKAGFVPVRADEVKQTNLIHLDILQKLIDSPIAICDLSNRNPNVLFELGLRQAFDKPTVLVQEVGTPKIFDISPLRYTEYRKELKYREVLEDQNFISDALTATKEATDKGEGINSIVSLLSLSSPASLKDITDNDATKMLQIVMSEMNDLRTDFRRTISQVSYEKERSEQVYVRSRSENEYLKCRRYFDKFRISLETKNVITDVRLAYDAFQESVMKTVSFELPDSRLKILREMLSTADKLLADYVSNNSK
jgi:hypothetical protein